MPRVCEQKKMSRCEIARKAPFHCMLLYTAGNFFYEKAELLGNLDASFTTWINLIRKLDIFLLRPCRCSAWIPLFKQADPKSWTLAKIKTSSLTSRGTGSGVYKRFRRVITRKTRRGRNFYHGAVRRSEILITRTFYGTLSALSRYIRSGNTPENICT